MTKKKTELIEFNLNSIKHFCKKSKWKKLLKYFDFFSLTMWNCWNYLNFSIAFIEYATFQWLLFLFILHFCCLIVCASINFCIRMITKSNWDLQIEWKWVKKNFFPDLFLQFWGGNGAKSNKLYWLSSSAPLTNRTYFSSLSFHLRFSMCVYLRVHLFF